jgi:hypothetical protein
MYVRGYLQGSENGRVVTIEVWGLSMHLYFRRDGVSCRLWRAPLKSWIQPLPESSNNSKKSRGHEYQSSKECEYFMIFSGKIDYHSICFLLEIIKTHIVC